MRSTGKQMGDKLGEEWLGLISRTSLKSEVELKDVYGIGRHQVERVAVGKSVGLRRSRK